MFFLFHVIPSGSLSSKAAVCLRLCLSWTLRLRIAVRPVQLLKTTSQTIIQKDHLIDFEDHFFYAAFSFCFIFLFNKRIDSIFNPDDALPGGICFSCLFDLFHHFFFFLQKRNQIRHNKQSINHVVF
jgi:hypothetical protein